MAMSDEQWAAFNTWRKREWQPQIHDALDAGDGARLEALYDRLWAEFPGDDEERVKLQYVLNSALAHMMEIGEFQMMRRWFPRFARWYPEDDEERRFFDGVIAWHTGEKERGRRVLADLYAEFGSSAFLKDQRYVSVATGAAEDVDIPGEVVDADSPRVAALVEQITDAMDAERWDVAVARCREALALLGDARLAEDAVWFLGTMGDAQMELGDWAGARDTFASATQAPGGMENPYIQLRLGECEYELGNQRAAANGLIAAHMADPDILADEPPRYRRFLQDQGLIS